MANWNLPVIGTLYTAILQALSDRLVDVARMFRSGMVEATNLPEGVIRWNSTASKWEQWSGSEWTDLAASYGINISGNAATASSCTGNAATATVAGACTGNAASATTAGACTGNAANATTAANAQKLNNRVFNWSGQSGQPAWVWGGSDGTNMYVYNPSNFSVNYATTANNANNLGGQAPSAFAAAGHSHAYVPTSIAAGGLYSYTSRTGVSGDFTKGGLYGLNGESGTWRCMSAADIGAFGIILHLFRREA